MAVKPLQVLIVSLILIAICAGAYYGLRQKMASDRATDEQKFISAYIALAVARERYSANPDSFNLIADRIYAKYQADSTWMRNFADRLAKNVGRSRHVWQNITSGLDSLRTEPRPLSDFN